MRIKKYVVDSVPEALEKIKVELGQNAIILNTKKIKTGGFLGLFTKQQIEVIAAIDQEKKGTQKTAQKSTSKDIRLGSTPSVTHQTVNFFEEYQGNLEEKEAIEREEKPLNSFKNDALIEQALSLIHI